MAHQNEIRCASSSVERLAGKEHFGDTATPDSLETIMARPASAPTPTLVLFVRHGQTPTTGETLPGRAAGLHLSSIGIAQAEAAAQRISTLKSVAAIYASPMERTLQTAEPIATARKLDVQQSAGLIECDFGAWTGKKLAELRKEPAWDTVQRYPSGFRFPQGESFTEMQHRAVATVDSLVERHTGATIVAVSHADVIKAIVAAAAGTPLDLFQRMVISPCSISAILYNSQGPTVLTVNSVGDELNCLIPS